MYEDDADLCGNPPLQLWEFYFANLRDLLKEFREWNEILDSGREFKVSQTAGEMDEIDWKLSVHILFANKSLKACYECTHELLRYSGLAWDVRAKLHKFWENSRYTPPLDDKHMNEQIEAQLIKPQFLTPERTSQIVDLRHIAERKVAELCEVKTEDAKAGSAPEPEYTSMTGKGMMNGKSANSMSKEALALATLADHPDWTNAQIAEAVGCNVKSLPRMSKFSKARIALASSRVELPKGWKGNSGSMESYDDD